MFDDEQTEQLQDTLDRLVAPHFRQRSNGKLYGRDAYRGHVREMRATVTGGRVEVVEQVRDGDRIAGRSLFHVVRARGSEATFESSIFAELASDGRIRRVAQLARVVDEDDQDEMLPR